MVNYKDLVTTIAVLETLSLDPENKEVLQEAIGVLSEVEIDNDESKLSTYVVKDVVKAVSRAWENNLNLDVENDLKPRWIDDKPFRYAKQYIMGDFTQYNNYGKEELRP
jgi:hypothetical protein